MNLKKIEDYIAKDEPEKGIEVLMNGEFRNCGSHEKEHIILLSSRFSSLKRKYHLGLLANQEYQIERNKLNFDLLAWVKRLHTQVKNPEASLNSESSPERFKGKRIGNYEIMNFIGAGGFGNVYLAKQIHLQNFSAIKISHEIKIGKEYLDDIISFGISSLKSLKHKNIISVHDVGEIEIDNKPRIYIVMDFVDGGTLDELPKVNLTKKQIQDKIKIFEKICLAINSAHCLKHTNRFGFEVHGLYHGDIKPQNVLIDKEKEPIIIDFMFVDMNSLYEVIVNRPQNMIALTSVFGTPGYMPFEQKQNGIVNRQTDIYSLGILLFEMFSSFRFSKLEEKSLNSIKKHLKKENKHIPNYVIKIIFETTRNNPAERLAKVNEILKKLETGKNSWWNKIFNK